MGKITELLFISFIFIGVYSGCSSKNSKTSNPSGTSNKNTNTETNTKANTEPVASIPTHSPSHYNDDDSSPPITSANATLPDPLPQEPSPSPSSSSLPAVSVASVVSDEPVAIGSDENIPNPSSPPRSTSNSTLTSPIITLNPSNNKQAKILTAYNVINFYLDKNNPEEISTFQLLFKLAQETNGSLALSFHPSSLSATIDLILESLLKTNPSLPSKQKTELIDVALVLDTTNSMHHDILNFKKTLPAILQSRLDLPQSLNEQKAPLRLGIIGYRDQNNQYTTRLFLDLTSDLYPINKAIEQLETGEGNKDSEEALLDGLETALDQLTWRAEATDRVVILVTDSPGHEKTLVTKKNVNQIISDYQSTAPQIKIYPVLTVTNPD